MASWSGRKSGKPKKRVAMERALWFIESRSGDSDEWRRREENGNWVKHFTRQSTRTTVVTRLC